MPRFLVENFIGAEYIVCEYIELKENGTCFYNRLRDGTPVLVATRASKNVTLE